MLYLLIDRDIILYNFIITVKNNICYIPYMLFFEICCLHLFMLGVVKAIIT